MDQKVLIATLKKIVAGFQRRYLKEHLKPAKYFYEDWNDLDQNTIKLKDLKFLGYKKVEDIAIWGMKDEASRRRRGWGKDMDRKEFIDKIAKETYREKDYFEYLFDSYEINKLPPSIAINGIISDGLGRAHWTHALDIPLLVAAFSST